MKQQNPPKRGWSWKYGTVELLETVPMLQTDNLCSDQEAQNFPLRWATSTQFQKSKKRCKSTRAFQHSNKPSSSTTKSFMTSSTSTTPKSSNRSRIQLIITTESDEPTLQIEDYLPPSNKIIILFRSPTSKLVVALDMDMNSTVRRLKERIHDKEGVQVSRLVVRANGVELQDQRSLRDTVFPTFQWLRFLTNVCKRVWGQRLRMKQRFQFQLPQPGYPLSYKGRVMDEYQSFQLYNVGEGDTIEILDASVRLLC
ncbi:hypothetical protein RJ639_003358 [Escallonia herrerae]|uniref:Ubiquitin-like domain-containing protein n=1 Tax=Escallonia herrerae TaxID=1293975 RepID=A0AA88WBQ7_9ASTE|nr:hypothetical protein RJ639_003358 [Escallonia herrerae]